MIAALATMAFLIAGWTALYAALVTSDDCGTKVLAALNGKSLAAEPMIGRPVAVRFATRSPICAQPVRAKAEWRAAA